MTVAELCSVIGEALESDYVSTGVVVLIVSSFLLELSKTKIRPWSWIIKKIGKIANEEVEQRLGVIESDIKSLKERNDRQDEKNAERDAVAARREILKFSDELRIGVVLHSKESFEQVLQDIDNYDRYCREHPDFKNNRTLSATKKIMTEYEHREATNDFLK